MALTFSITGGADAAKFTIGATTGVLAFKAAPDFEAPGDADANNIYVVEVGVSDGVATTKQTINVTVTDVPDANLPPQITSPATKTVQENSTAVMTVTATDPDAGGTTPPPVTGNDDDGFAGAPFGPANYPNLLSGLTARPSWKVAGVDYRVGVPSNITLKPKSQVTQIAGVEISGGSVNVNNDDTVIDGYDFGSSNLTLCGNNPIIRNCRINGMITTIHYEATWNKCKKATISKCTIVGRAGDWADVSFHGTELILEYILFDGAESDHVQLSGGVNNSDNNQFTCRWSFFQNAGFGGGHGDLIQTFNNGTNTLWKLVYNTTGPQVNTQGFMYEPDGTTAGDGAKLKGVGEVGWNTFTGGMNYYFGATYLDVAGHATSFTVHDNYYDANAVSAFCRPGQVVPRDGSSVTMFRDNINMRNGQKPSSAND